MWKKLVKSQLDELNVTIIIKHKSSKNNICSLDVHYLELDFIINSSSTHNMIVFLHTDTLSISELWFLYFEINVLLGESGDRVGR